MALIDTEEAAKRLARVILSDIELYFRERPRVGETLDGQIAEGRRLFTSRVTPQLAPLFDTVLADRRASNREKTPAPTGFGASGLAASAGDEPPWTQQATPGPVVVAQLLDDQPTPMPRAEVDAGAALPVAALPLGTTSLAAESPPPAAVESPPPAAAEPPPLAAVEPAPLAATEPPPPAAAEVAAASLPATDVTTPAPAAVAAPVSVSTAVAVAAAVPAPVAAAPAVAAPTRPVPAPAPVAAAPAVVAPTRPVPPAPPMEPPVPRLTPRISVPRLLVLLAIVGAALAVIAHALS